MSYSKHAIRVYIFLEGDSLYSKMRVLVTLFCYKLADKRADAGKTDIFFPDNCRCCY